MVCQYCKKDVDTPCHTMQEVQQRASDHVERCEGALEPSEGREPGPERRQHLAPVARGALQGS
jgi:hypothetical protein